MKTLGLFAIVLVTGAVGWTVSAASPSTGMALWFGGMVGTLVLGLVIAFKKTLSVPLILLYAVVEGLFMGAVSQYFNESTPASSARRCSRPSATFAGMFLAYKIGLIKVTAKFRRIMTMMIFGYAIFASSTSSSRWSPTPVRLRRRGLARHRHLALRHRPGLVHARARLRLDRARHPQRRPAAVLVAPRARPHRDARLALHRVPPPVRPPPRVTEDSTHDTAGAGSPAPAVSSA